MLSSMQKKGQQSNKKTVTFENLVKEDFINIKDVNIREGINYAKV